MRGKLRGWKEKRMSIASYCRTAFTPVALRKYAELFDQVWDEIASEGLLDTFKDRELVRTRLAANVFRLARSSWSDAQMRQLLIRGFRNEATRLQREA